MPTTVFNHLFENLDKGAGPELLRPTSEPKKLHRVPGCQKDSGQRRKIIHLRKFIILRTEILAAAVLMTLHTSRPWKFLLSLPPSALCPFPTIIRQNNPSNNVPPVRTLPRFFHGTCTAEPPPVCHDVANLDFPMRSVLFEFSLKINGFT